MEISLRSSGVNRGAWDYRGRRHPLGLIPVDTHSSGERAPTGRARCRFRRRCADAPAVRGVGQLQRRQETRRRTALLKSGLWPPSLFLGEAARVSRERSDYESGGQEFESLRARQLSFCT
jgi:hypothetical protein